MAAAIAEPRTAAAHALIHSLFPGGPGSSRSFTAHADGADAYGERLALGRGAQLGEQLVYRPGAIGCEVDGALTYGEFDLPFFSTLLDAAVHRHSNAPARGRRFVDAGSGCGRLVFAAAVLQPSLSRCVGVEKVPELHALACQAASRCEMPAGLPPCEFLCADALEFLCTPHSQALAPDCIFAYCSTWPSEGDVLTDFSLACAALPVGTRIITTDKRLGSDKAGRWQYELLMQLEGPNAETGGTSVGYVWEVSKSVCWDKLLV
eukprot:CAMPEP_0119364262 /NCGR_PEP_ID=MMETSP1334-20130426/11181_1 /TAXON_ID=127549 /ORGANISM="Calcidiscus leptoporus, Strain RCC1130" /LENGTH=262 /DNA_ID=CAMNT_0007379915 /DNA_START=96 /DNA_END=884 /DNA_ORIENTATION=-